MIGRRVLAVLLMLSTLSAMADARKRILFFGDSVTEFGVKPGGYITRIQESLDKAGVAEQVELIGAGVAGNKVYDLYLRMPDDVLSKEPDVVVIYIGINDVWHKSLLGTGTDPDKFERFYSAIIKTLQDRKIALVLCTPTVVGERKEDTNPQDGDLNYYASLIRALAEKYHCQLCDLRKAFVSYIAENNPENKDSGILTTDRVHLNDKGNQLVADLLLKTLGYK